MNGIEIINASAGSGKTYSLTKLVVQKLRDGLAPESLMAITFTNKAAAELRGRIRTELLKHGMADEAQQILDGFVGTVNAVCARLLREYALDAGLSPAIDVLPEEDSDRLFGVAIAGVIEKYAGTLEPAAKRLSLIGGGSDYRKLGDWRQDVREIVNKARSNQLTVDDLRACGRQSWETLKDILGESLGQDLSKQLAGAVSRAIENLDEIEEPGATTKNSLNDLKKFDRQWQRGNITWSGWVRISKLKTTKKCEGLLNKTKILAADVLKHPAFHVDLEQLITGACECAAEALEAYETFKQKQGLMDFVDQEAKVLGLARGNDAFRASMTERLQQVMVDEFQDTNPIQLALFLEFNKLAGRSTWVGDPKQSIYGFRDADPQLMDEVTRLIKDTDPLDESWRSCTTLVAFTNEVFSKVFHELEREKVWLNIPKARKKEAEGGWIEAWHVPKVNDKAAEATAAGVRDLLDRRDDIAPGDIAVLCRKHDDCKKVAASLEAIGIRASATQDSLLETRECQLALAALRYLHDRQDAIALTEIVSLSPLHADHGSWLATLMEEQETRDAFKRWQEDPLIVALDEMRPAARHWTPLEALEQAIDRVELIGALKSWPNAALRMSNLDLLRGKCCEYLDQCRARRSAATIPGFLKYLQEAKPGRAQGAGEQTVQVSTYHSAKGLEWPVVILTNLDSEPKGRVFGINVLPAPEFDPTAPLASRSIRYWPWPFGGQGAFPELEEILADRKEQIAAQLKETRECQRLMYVAMTRAREGLVFSIQKKVTKKDTSLMTKWLDALTDAEGNRILSWPMNTGEQTLDIGETKIPLTVREFTADEAETADIQEPDAWLAPAAAEAVAYPVARFSPSALVLPDDQAAAAVFNKVAELGKPFAVKGDNGGAALGSAIHAFLGADLADQNEAALWKIAADILERWGVAEVIAADDLVESRTRLMNYVKKNYPAARILTEWPLTLINDDNQLMRGWADMLLELPDGYVVIDHKSYSAAEAEQQAGRYAPQLAAYGDAIAKATGKPVLDLLLHMPLAGTVLRLK